MPQPVSTQPVSTQPVSTQYGAIPIVSVKTCPPGVSYTCVRVIVCVCVCMCVYICVCVWLAYMSIPAARGRYTNVSEGFTEYK